MFIMGGVIVRKGWVDYDPVLFKEMTKKFKLDEHRLIKSLKRKDNRIRVTESLWNRHTIGQWNHQEHNQK